jgi:trehalose/maltose hydrolase-like predicted phosphorylase
LNTDYKSARRILLSKIRYLNEAKQNAEKIKKPGALYTDDQFNLYINALTVVNFVDYIERTADKSLLALGGLEMLLEISKFYLSIIKPNAKKTNYQVLNVTSLDGSIKNIDNSALLNYLIKDCFGKTANMVALAKTENRKEVEEYLKTNDYDKQIDNMREVRRKLYQQSPNVNNLVQYYDGYFKEEREISNPDLVNLFMLYPDDFKELVKKENYIYYSKFANPDPLGKINLAFIACSKGYEKESNKYFRNVLGLNLCDDANKLNFEQTYLDLGVASALNLYLVYGLAGLKHDRYLLMADSFIPNDIRRLEFKINIANNIGSIKIKRNSATVEWQ